MEVRVCDLKEWCPTEEWIIAEIQKIERVGRKEAIRRMQRRKDSMKLRGATEAALKKAAKRFPRPEERAYEMTPAHAAALAANRKLRWAHA